MDYIVKSVTGIGIGLLLTTSMYAVEIDGGIAISSEQQNSTQYGSAESSVLDYANAIPMEKIVQATTLLQMSGSANTSVKFGKPGFERGGAGTGEKMLEKLPTYEKTTKTSKNTVAPAEFGTSNHPYSTSRVDMYGQRLSTKKPNRITGKLYFNNHGSTYVCSASSIKKGIVVTAAHCVSDYGSGNFYSDWEFVPAFFANRNVARAPYGRYSAKTAIVKTSYLNGTDNCSVPGVVCQNDVAILVMNPTYNPKTGTNMLPGARTGWYGYAWGAYSFTNYQNRRQAQITQMGYPVSHDRGYMMQRNDSIGYISPKDVRNTVIGSRETGGSSGGPWLVNYGQVAALSGTSVGAKSRSNIVVGTTSWGYTSGGPKEQGASPFTAGNIRSLVNYACRLYPANCK